ncbi:MAG TPA: acyl carrier protein [Symbiobacteriaceae bacterium]|nr:acyl carrier protein [Symbiobacteriaceae bacterium]
MTTENLSQRVIELIADEFQIPIHTIREDSRIIDDLGLDSFGLINLIARFEEEFHIKLSDDSLTRIKTVHDAAEFLQTLIPA